jgi:cell division septation protein DedD
MKRTFICAALVAFAAPVLADDQPAQQDERLGDLEHMVITAVKEQPAENVAGQRLNNLEHMTITAPKEQPADYAVDDKTAELLAEIEEE